MRSSPEDAYEAVAALSAERRSTRFGGPVVALVGSAGGLRGFVRVLEELPADFPAAVVVVLHLQAEQPSMLAAILGRSSSMPVKQAEAGDRLAPGHVYVAPPGVHLLVLADGSLQLDRRPPIHFLRPSADVLLESLASTYAADCIAVVFSGTGSDGAAGAAALKASGGVVLAQDEESSDYFGMPSAAIASGAVDQVLALERIAPAVLEFVRPCPA
jgi:two-component system, chemotaxis family, protein-glutamate methylesterase/glutaminase